MITLPEANRPKTSKMRNRERFKSSPDPIVPAGDTLPLQIYSKGFN